ncbi:MAG: TlpA disulfide reductase family protein [Polyangia bacterium]|nr:TlpA disulfide reductase family protein [Polyangia bacterium]
MALEHSGPRVCYAPWVRSPLAMTMLAMTLPAMALGLGACPQGAGSGGAGSGGAGPKGPARPGARGAVDVTFTALSGEPLRLSSFRGKPLVMMFFTTWCVPCQVQGSRFKPLRAAIGAHRVTFLAVSVDTERNLVPTFLEAAGFDFPAAYADPEMVRQSPIGPTRDVPRTVVLDREGRLVADLQGPVEPKALLILLKALL